MYLHISHRLKAPPEQGPSFTSLQIPSDSNVQWINNTWNGAWTETSNISRKWIFYKNEEEAYYNFRQPGFRDMRNHRMLKTLQVVQRSWDLTGLLANEGQWDWDVDRDWLVKGFLSLIKEFQLYTKGDEELLKDFNIDQSRRAFTKVCSVSHMQMGCSDMNTVSGKWLQKLLQIQVKIDWSNHFWSSPMLGHNLIHPQWWKTPSLE